MEGERPERFLRILLNALMLWAGVGLTVWLVFLIVFTPHDQDTPIRHGGVQADVVKAKEFFAQRCVPCHGNTGHGDGPNAALLTPKPRQFADASWQASVTDEQIEATIRLGGQAMGKSSVMPAASDLAAQPQILAGLRVVVRDFKR